MSLLLGLFFLDGRMTFKKKTERFQNGFFHRLALLQADRPDFGLAFASAIFSAMSTRS